MYAAAENGLGGFVNVAGLSECCFFLLLRRSCGVFRRYFGITARNNLGSFLHRAQGKIVNLNGLIRVVVCIMYNLLDAPAFKPF